MRYKVPTITLFVSVLSVMSCGAQPPAPPPPPPPGPAALAPPPPPPPGRGGRGPMLPGPLEQGARTTVNGVVQSFSYGPGGLDGLILDRGTVVHFPLEYSRQVSATAPVGSAVSATGWSHTGPAGDTLFDADTITNQRSRTSIAVVAGPLPGPRPPVPPVLAGTPTPPEPPAGPVGYGPQPPPPPPEAGRYVSSPSGYAVPSPVVPSTQSTGIAGTVRSYNYEISGQVNGLVLSDGTAVYFPAEFGTQVAGIVSLNGHVRVTGWLRIGPRGNRLMDAEVITSPRTGNSVAITNTPGPR